MSELIEIDGGEGEGGGQVLRSALALGLHTKRPFRIVNIRKTRSKPGLMRQHLAGVKLAARVGAAEVLGAEIGSAELTFRPHTVICGEHHAAVGGAGSAILVIQAVIPALLCAETETKLVVAGGTHNMAAPTFDFLDRAFRPLIERMGPRVEMSLVKHGFFPAGGGQIDLEISPSASLKPLELQHRGGPKCQRASALVSRIPSSIGDRELDRVKSRLGWTDLEVIEVTDSPGPGNVIQLECISKEAHELVTGFGRKNKTALDVADSAIDQMRAYLKHEAPVGEHLADQLMLLMAMSGGGFFRSAAPTQHALTNMEVIRRFLDVRLRYEQEDEKHWRFSVG